MKKNLQCYHEKKNQIAQLPLYYSALLCREKSYYGEEDKHTELV